MVNIRAKGAGGEREVADRLNAVVKEVLGKLEIEVSREFLIQRNQNQTAVGGCDLTNTFGYDIEVKRCETLQINQWFAQVESVSRGTGRQPVLIYRQSRKPWQCVMYGGIFDGTKWHRCRITVSFDDFLHCFREHCKNALAGSIVQGKVKNE